MKIFSTCIAFLACAVATPLFGATLAEENFESYAVNAAIAGLNGGSGWAAGFSDNGGATQTIIAGGLNYSSGQIMVSGGNRAMQVAAGTTNTVILDRQTSSSLGNVVYLSFLYSHSVEVGNTSDFMQVGFEDSANSNPLGSVIDSSGTFITRLGTAGGNGTESSIGGTTHFIVLRLEDTGGATGYDTSTLYIDPDMLDEMMNTVDGANTGNIAVDPSNPLFLTLRHANNEAGDIFLSDEFRIGDTFASVLPAVVVVPEPASIALWALLGLTLVGFGRRRVCRK